MRTFLVSGSYGLVGSLPYWYLSTRIRGGHHLPEIQWLVMFSMDLVILTALAATIRFHVRRFRSLSSPVVRIFQGAFLACCGILIFAVTATMFLVPYVPAHFPTWTPATTLYMLFRSITHGYATVSLFALLGYIWTLDVPTKPVEPTGISSFPSDLTTSHTSGESPGGSLRR